MGVSNSTTALWQLNFGSPESQHKLCWVQGTLNYSFVLTGHIWSIGLACRTLAVLMVRVSPGASTQDSQNFWQWIDSNVTVGNVFITNCLANAAAGSTILACSAHDEPHHLVVTGGGCWSASRNASWLLVFWCFLAILSETLLFCITVSMINRKSSHLPSRSEQLFRSIAQLTGGLLLVDWALTIFIGGRHLTLLLDDGLHTGFFACLLLSVENVGYCALYPGAVAGVVLLTLSHEAGHTRVLEGNVLCFQAPALLAGRGEQWMSLQESMIGGRRSSLAETAGPQIQAWQEENAPDLPFSFVPYCLNTLIDLHGTRGALEAFEDPETLGEQLRDLLDMFTQERQARARLRVTGPVELEPEVEDEEDDDEDVALALQEAATNAGRVIRF